MTLVFTLHCFSFFYFFFLHFFFFLLVTAAVVFYESGGIFFTWVSVEKGGQSIKFELLKTIATSPSIVSVCCLISLSICVMDVMCFLAEDFTQLSFSGYLIQLYTLI